MDKLVYPYWFMNQFNINNDVIFYMKQIYCDTFKIISPPSDVSINNLKKLGFNYNDISIKNYVIIDMIYNLKIIIMFMVMVYLY